MSELKKLLHGVKVERKPLGEIATIGTGSSNRQDENINGKYNFYVRSKNILRSNIYQFDEKAIIIPGEGGIGEIFHYVDGKYALHQRAYRINVDFNNINTKYVFYIMSNSFKKYITSKSVGATASSIRKPMLESFKIPIPCPENPEKSLQIQEEIVRILDALTEEINVVTNELDKELQVRQKQYEYYREELFKFDGKEVECRSFGDIGEVKRGVAFTKKQAILGEFPVVANAAEPISFHNVFNRDGEIIVIARSGANAGLISYWNEKLYLTDAFSIHPENSVLNTKFAYYYLKMRQQEIHLMKRGTGVPHVRASDFEIYKIPVPSLVVQHRIVLLLDKFEEVSNAIIDEFKKEIELRNKQYEYYRDLLLTFPSDIN